MTCAIRRLSWAFLESALVHLNGSVGHRSTGVDLNAIRRRPSTISRCFATAPRRSTGSGCHRRCNQTLSLQGWRVNACQRGRGEVRPVEGVVRRQQLHAEWSSVQRKGSAIDFSDGGSVVDAGGSWGLAAGKGTVTIAAEYRHHDLGTNRASLNPPRSSTPESRGKYRVSFHIQKPLGNPDEDRAITSLLIEVFAGEGYPERLSAEIMSTPDLLRQRGDLLVAKSAIGDLLGIVGVCVRPTNPARQVAELDEVELHLLAVHPKARGPGRWRPSLPLVNSVRLFSDTPRWSFLRSPPCARPIACMRGLAISATRHAIGRWGKQGRATLFTKSSCR